MNAWNGRDIHDLITQEKVWVFCDGIREYTRPNVNDVLSRCTVKEDGRLYITKKREDKDTFRSNLNPRTEIRLEHHKLKEGVLYKIRLVCSVDSISNANFFQILNRDEQGKAFPLFQLEKRDGGLNTRQRLNDENRRDTRVSTIQGFGRYTILFRSGENGVLTVVFNDKPILQYTGVIRSTQDSWIQFGVYGDRDIESTNIVQSLSIEEDDDKDDDKDDDIDDDKDDDKEHHIQLNLVIKNNKIVGVHYD